jgi:protein-S-isoprenylcysteine O-methyltransferase Ste14
MFGTFAAALLILGWSPMLIGVRRQGFRGAFFRPHGAPELPPAAPRDDSVAPAAGRAGLRPGVARFDGILLLLTWIVCMVLTALAVVSVRHAATSFRIGAGVVLFLAGIGAWIWGRNAWEADFSQVARAPAALVTRGPYRFVRHPLYLSTALAALGQATAAGGWRDAALWTLLAVVLSVRARREERILESAFGAVWRDYARSARGF